MHNRDLGFLLLNNDTMKDHTFYNRQINNFDPKQSPTSNSKIFQDFLKKKHTNPVVALTNKAGKKDWDIFSQKTRNTHYNTVSLTSKIPTKQKAMSISGQQQNVKENAFSKTDVDIVYKDDHKSIGSKAFDNDGIVLN
jgi:hypothetical protein